TRHGSTSWPSLRRLRRNLTIRSVIVAPLPNGPSDGYTFKNDLGSKRPGRFARWRRDGAKKLRPNCAAVDWLGRIPPAHLAMKDKPLRYSRRLVESRQRPQLLAPSETPVASPVCDEVRRHP